MAKRTTKAKTTATKKKSGRKARSMEPVWDPDLGMEVCPCCMELGEHFAREREEAEYQEALTRREKPEARARRERCFAYTPHPDWNEILHVFPGDMWAEKAVEAWDTIVFEDDEVDFLKVSVEHEGREIEAFFTTDFKGAIWWTYDGVRTPVRRVGAHPELN